MLDQEIQKYSHYQSGVRNKKGQREDQLYLAKSQLVIVSNISLFLFSSLFGQVSLRLRLHRPWFEESSFNVQKHALSVKHGVPASALFGRYDVLRVQTSELCGRICIASTNQELRFGPWSVDDKISEWSPKSTWWRIWLFSSWTLLYISYSNGDIKENIILFLFFPSSD